MSRNAIQSTQPYWHIGLDWAALTSGIETLPTQTEVAIIGGGLTGLSAALCLARAGKQVVLLEANSIGSGASSRSGGMLGPSFFKLGLDGLIKKFGENIADQVMRESINGFRWMSNFIETEQIDCSLNWCGRFRGARKVKHFEDLQRHAEVVNKHLNVPVSVLQRKDLGDEIGSDRYCGAILYNLDATLDPGKLTYGLAKKVLNENVAIYPGKRVDYIKKTYAGFDIRCGQQVLRAQAVLVATNGYTDESTPYIKRRIIPIRSAIVATEPLPTDLVKSCLRRNRGYGETNRMVSYYRGSPDGTRILYGGRAIDWFKDRPAEYGRYLSNSLFELFPQLTPKKIDYAWSGMVAYTFDHVPHFGCHDGLYFSVGYCGSGVARAAYLGNLVAKMMLGCEVESPFLNFSFETKFMYNGTPWFMPYLLRWHAIADRLDI